jgi:hypothetical protein
MILVLTLLVLAAVLTLVGSLVLFLSRRLRACLSRRRVPVARSSARDVAARTEALRTAPPARSQYQSQRRPAA